MKLPPTAGWIGQKPAAAKPSQTPRVGSEFLPTIAYPVAQSYYQMQGDIGAAQAAAQGQIGAAKAAAEGQAAGQAAIGQGQATTGIANAYANNYGGYAGALGNVATAQANERANFYNANALAEQGRQTALGTLGAAGLGAYGSAANSALGAWATNQTAYNKALADMQAANQAALSGYGSSRNAALGQFSTALGGMATGLGNASRTDQSNVSMPSFGGGGFGGGFGGSGFMATGPGGMPVGFGTYGGRASGGYGGMDMGGISGSKTSAPGTQFPGIVASGFGGMNNALTGLMSGDVLNQMGNNDAIGRMQLDNQHYTSRGMPSQMLNQALGGIAGLSGMNIDAIGSGMNQYYNTANDPRNRADFNPVLQGLQTGYNASTGGLNTLSRAIPGTLTPLQMAQERDAAAQFNKQVRDRDAQPQAPAPTAPRPVARPAPRPSMPSGAQQPMLKGRDAAMEAAKLQAQYQQIRNSIMRGSYDNASVRDMTQRADALWRMQELANRIASLQGREPRAA